MKVLITGGAGFIGSTLAIRLVRDGHTVLILDNFNDAYDPILKWRNVSLIECAGSCQILEGDIRDAPFVQRVLSSHAIDVVVHLAGLAGVRASLRNPTMYFDHNLNGTAVLLDAMREAGMSRLVVASSSSVYGNRIQGPFRETDAADEPVSPYALSKRAVELLCQQYHQLYGLNAYCMRLFTVYGPRQRPDMAISQFLNKLYQGEPIRLYGDGRSKRDYTYVDDIVDGLARAIERVAGYEIINLGSASPVSLMDLVYLLIEQTNQAVRIDWHYDQPGDVPLTYASVDKAQALLGYRPAVDLTEGLRRMVAQFSPVFVPALL